MGERLGVPGIQADGFVIVGECAVEVAAQVSKLPPVDASVGDGGIELERLRVVGEGKVELPNNQLTIGANGLVKAEVQAKTVIVIGKVAGNVRGTERIEIQATGIVDGDVAAPRLVVAEGAVLNGSIQMTQKQAGTGASPAPVSHPTPLAAAGGSKG